MVVLSHPSTPAQTLSVIPTSNTIPITTASVQIPVVDLSDPGSKTRIVRACEDFGCFKIVNNGIGHEIISRLENEAMRFFALSQDIKDKAGPPDPFGYGSKRIGPNGDVGWIEYILLNANPQVTSIKSLAVFQKNREIFRSAVEEYMAAMKKLATEVLETMADGLGISPIETLSRMIREEKSDSILRLNHYPERPIEEEEDEEKQSEIRLGFGEHTDPQIISILRSNNASGLQICLTDGTWLAVSPDPFSFFVNVGDSLQVLTNGRFKSVKHRVVTDPENARLSMIYFGGPSLGEKITALPCLVQKEEDKIYKDFTWFEYKMSAYKSRLGDNRLALFEKKNKNPNIDKHH